MIGEWAATTDSGNGTPVVNAPVATLSGGKPPADAPTLIAPRAAWKRRGSSLS